MNELTYGAVVLSAKSATPIPMLPSSHLEDHISGSVFQGSAGGVGAYMEEYFFPSRGRSYRLTSSGKDDYHQELVSAVSDKSTSESQDFRSHFAEVCRRFTTPGKHLTLTQSQPFGLVGLHSNEGGLRLFGLFNKSCELLVWSNSPDVDHIYQRDGRRDWRVYRFKERPSFDTVIFTRRVCQRWYRWTAAQHPTDFKFQALEASLLSHEDERLYSIPTAERTGSEEE